jgi:hypothetical protein
VSAQIITALRKRADALDAEAEITDKSGQPMLMRGPDYLYSRDPATLRFMATEFRLLANEAEGKT